MSDFDSRSSEPQFRSQASAPDAETVAAVTCAASAFRLRGESGRFRGDPDAGPVFHVAPAGYYFGKDSRFGAAIPINPKNPVDGIPLGNTQSLQLGAQTYDLRGSTPTARVAFTAYDDQGIIVARGRYGFERDFRGVWVPKTLEYMELEKKPIRMEKDGLSAATLVLHRAIGEYKLESLSMPGCEVFTGRLKPQP